MQNIKSIYLSDDDLDDREFFKAAFENVCMDHTLLMFDNNIDLLEKVKQPGSAVPDIFFMDLSMPELNGLECLRMVREIPHLANIPVVIYSTVTTPMFVEEVHELGAAHFIRKPYDFYELVNLIKYVVERDWDPTAETTPFDDFVLSYNSIKKPLL